MSNIDHEMNNLEEYTNVFNEDYTNGNGNIFFSNDYGLPYNITDVESGTTNYNYTYSVNNNELNELKKEVKNLKSFIAFLIKKSFGYTDIEIENIMMKMNEITKEEKKVKNDDCIEADLFKI